MKHMYQKFFRVLFALILFGAGCARQPAEPHARQAPQPSQTGVLREKCPTLYAENNLILTGTDVSSVLGGTWEYEGDEASQVFLRVAGECRFNIISNVTSTKFPPKVSVLAITESDFNRKLKIIRGEAPKEPPIEGQEIHGIGDTAFSYRIEGGLNLISFFALRKGNSYAEFTCHKSMKPAVPCDQSQYESLGRIIASRIQ